MGEPNNVSSPKKGFKIATVIVLIGIISAGWYWFFYKSPPNDIKEKNIVPVKVISISEQLNNISVEYTGTVNAKEIKEYGFKTGGVIASIPVSNGQKITKGQLLASLDIKDLQLAAEAAANTRNNAQSIYDFTADNYEKTRKLQEAGAVAEQELDKARQELDAQENLVKNARLDYQNRINQLDDANLSADMNGVVADVIGKEGLVISPGHPVVIVRSEELTVNVGLTQKDIDIIHPGTSAKVFINEQEIAGVVTKIDQLPDPQVKTYNAEIPIAGNYPLGSTAKIVFDLGEKEGTFIPIKAVMNDGNDFVYLVEDNKAVKKAVKLGVISNTRVQVEGLKNGDLLVIEGIRKLNEGSTITICE